MSHHMSSHVTSATINNDHTIVYPPSSSHDIAIFRLLILGAILGTRGLAPQKGGDAGGEGGGANFTAPLVVVSWLLEVSDLELT